jgi:hypothetical protein
LLALTALSWCSVCLSHTFDTFFDSASLSVVSDHLRLPVDGATAATVPFFIFGFHHDVRAMVMSVSTYGLDELPHQQ